MASNYVERLSFVGVVKILDKVELFTRCKTVILGIVLGGMGKTRKAKERESFIRSFPSTKSILSGN